MSDKIEMDMVYIHQLRQEGKTFKEIAEMYDCHRSTVNRRYNQWKKENEFLHKVQHVDEIPEAKTKWHEKLFNFLSKLMPNIEWRW